MTDAATSSRLPPIGFFIVLALAAVLYALMAMCLAEYASGHGDAMGRGFAAAFAFVFGLALWAALAILLLIAGIKGAMPVWAAIAAALLLPLSAVAAGIALDQDRDPAAFWWVPLLPVALPAILPPVWAAYAVWARFPRFHGVLSAGPTSAALFAIITLLTVAPLPQFVVTEQRRAAARREHDAEQRAAAEKEAQRRADNRARFAKLTADSPLADWAAFFGRDSELREEAIAAARKLPRRQADAEAALRRGLGFPLIDYARLDLAATPEFCAAAGEFLRANAVAHPAPRDEPGEVYAFVERHFTPYLDPIELLTGAGCDLDSGIGAIVETLRAFPEGRARDGFLGMLAWRRGNGFYKREASDRALVAYSEAIGYSPQNEQFHDSRGNLYYDREDYDRAIADYDEAVRISPYYAAAIDSRANAYHQKGDDERALADYAEAIRVNAQFSLTFNNRGALYQERGDYQQALQDFDEALRLEPRFGLAAFNRGRTHFFVGDYPRAVDDLILAAELKKDDAYRVLWLYLARARAGLPTAQESLHSDAAKLDRSAWPWPIIAALLGEQVRDAVLRAAREGDAAGQRGQECEASFYFGAKAAGENDPAAARDLLTRAAALCPRSFIETPGTKAELARLGSR